MGKSWKKSGMAANAAKKGLIFTKLAREIQVAAKAGGPDPAMNSRLRLAIEAAKKHSCPNDTIDRAIKKGAGLLEGSAQIEEVSFEGYGPHGVGVIIECQTDNRNRTVPEVRNVFKKHDCNMGESNSVAWMFKRMGLIEGIKLGQFDPEEEAIEAGADEVQKIEDGHAFFCVLENMNEVKAALEKRGWKVSACEPAYLAGQKTDLTAEQLNDVHAFLEAMEDLDDAHRVFATIA